MFQAKQALLACCAVALATPAASHHSYAMFDQTQRHTIAGTLAKVDWSNPHITIWVYVLNKASSSGYDLYAFASGGINLMMRSGWTKTTLKQGEKLTIEFFPLKDGGMGGEFLKATHADGSVTLGDRAAASALRGE